VGLKPSITLAFILAFFVSLFNIYAQNAAQLPVFPRLEPDEKALYYYQLGLRSGGYSWQDLAEISLWSSGDLSLANLEKIKAAVTALNNSADFPARGRERAEFVLSFLHKNYLKSYSLYQTRIDTVLTNGVYNCVSSAVFFIILCESAGIRTSGVITKEHAFAIVHIDNRDFDVETTNRYGFDPGNKKEFHDSSGNITGFAYVPPQNYRDRQTISNIELVSLILNNRIAEQERRNRYADAVPLAINRAAILFGNSLTVSSEGSADDLIFVDPRKDLLDRLTNYGSTLLKANREENAISWAEIACARYPANEHWQEYFFAAVNNRISRFVKEKKITEAVNFLENNKKYLSEKSYAQLDVQLFDTGIINSINLIKNADDGNIILVSIKQSLEGGKIGGKRAEELITYNVQKTASVLGAAPERNWRSAIQYIEAAISAFGTNKELDQVLKTYKDNLATDYHNRFAAEWNKKNYDAAERILNEGLKEFPTDRQLLSNRDIVNRQKETLRKN
jgi:tetratricopeptide (TPR) repeat protein